MNEFFQRWTIGRRVLKNSLVSFVFLALFLSTSVVFAKPKVVVHLPIDVKAKTLQKQLAEQLPSLEVIVYGRSSDFHKAIKKQDGDAFLAFRVALEKGKVPVTVSIQGLIKGEGVEPYYLIGTSAPDLTESSKMATRDLLGRRAMPKFVNQALGFTKVKVKVANKTEDLLTLLQLNQVDLLLVRKSSIEKVQAKSNQKLETKKLSSMVFGLPAVGILNKEVEKAVVDAFLGMSTEAKKGLGVETWKKL